MTEQLKAPVLYIDANPFIYAIEGDDNVASPIEDLFSFLKRRPGAAITSELTLAEVLPKASLRHKRQYLDLLIWSGLFELQPITRSILLETVRYRRFVAARRSASSRKMLRLPDAIHVVTAIQANCRYFLSADGGLKLPSKLKITKPDTAGISALIQAL